MPHVVLDDRMHMVNISIESYSGMFNPCISKAMWESNSILRQDGLNGSRTRLVKG